MPNQYSTLLIGGLGQIGSGLRTYLPRLDSNYRVVSVDLPDARDKASEADAHNEIIELDICESRENFKSVLEDFDLVVYLARKNDLDEMNAMTDLVFESVAAQKKPPMIVASSSVHVVDGIYNYHDKSKYPDYWNIAERNFDTVDPAMDRIPANIPAHAISDYGREKEHAENWCKKFASKGLGAIAARWGGINERNAVLDISERAYFSLWCHQEDSARFVHSCYERYINGTLPSGAHYFVISDNDYNIFDIETPLREVGYVSVHNAENFYK